MASKMKTVQRKNLSEQLDRLDGVLEGMADTLNGSVANAIRDAIGLAVKEAVETTLRQMLSNPELMRMTQPKHAPQPTPVQPEKKTLRGALNRLLQKAGKVARSLGRAWTWCLEKVKRGLGYVSGRVKSVAGNCKAACVATANVFRIAWSLRKVCLVSLVVGGVVGMGSYVAGPVIASVACALSTMVVTLTGGALLPVWRWLQRVRVA